MVADIQWASGRFVALISSLGGPRDVARQVFRNVIEPAYEGRPYHNIRHIEACLQQFEAYVPPKDKVPAIPLALWFHDLVYDPIRQDNEERSAAALRKWGRSLNIPSDALDAAGRAILATQHATAPGSLVDEYVVDIDLSILGVPFGEFDVYEDQVREEFSFVGDRPWAQGRTAFLRRLLDRDWIFSTTAFRRRYEGAARSNLKRSIEKLSALV